MRLRVFITTLFVFLLLLTFKNNGCASLTSQIEDPARNVISRLIGKRANDIDIEIIKSENGNDLFEVEASNNRLIIKGNSPVAICSGFYYYFKKACNGMVSWSGNHIPDLTIWPDYIKEKKVSPYQYRHYLNVVTFGYTTPYWNWQRWEKEIDWMALHGVNMPLALVAQEAIAIRVWQKLGLKKEIVNHFFTSGAYLPWHRMGNLNSWPHPLDDSWHKQQLELQHKILQRMRELNFKPVVPAFAGFVPKEFKSLHPEIFLNELSWGGFPKENHSYVLSPKSPWFKNIGRLYIQEWEKEFGKCDFYLGDSFNEMDVPVPKDDSIKKYEVLADYGKAVYESIISGNKDATWVTQGWLFGNMRNFWDKSSVKALFSKVPDNKMIVVDLANEYPTYVWNSDQMWNKHEGFYGKQWIYCFVPNFGGKTPLNGVLKFYAENPSLALQSPYSKNLKGFGVAPEGIENNEVVYELLNDVSWNTQPIEINQWIKDYVIQRYGYASKNILKAWSLLIQSCYNSFNSYPRFAWQTLTDKSSKGKVNDDYKFLEGVRLFLSDTISNTLKDKTLYTNDAIEFASMFLSIKANEFYKVALLADKNGDDELKKLSFQKVEYILKQVDRLLASHPIYRLEYWLDYARMQGNTIEEKNRYESEAKRLITTWGGHHEDYAAKVWSGIISEYYIPRLQQYLFSKESKNNEFKENWINSHYINKTIPFKNPINMAKKLVHNYMLP